MRDRIATLGVGVLAGIAAPLAVSKPRNTSLAWPVRTSAAITWLSELTAKSRHTGHTMSAYSVIVTGALGLPSVLPDSGMPSISRSTAAIEDRLTAGVGPPPPPELATITTTSATTTVAARPPSQISRRRVSGRR